VLQRQFILTEAQPVALLLPGQVADDPANAVHRHKALACVFIGQTFERALEFAARKA